MVPDMDGTRGDLPRITLFGRAVKPVAFGLTLTMLIIAQANIRMADRGVVYPLSVVLAVLAILSAVMLTVGWFGRQQRLAEYGLLMVVAVYLTRAVFVFMESGPDQAVWFSLTTVIIAGGSYFLEASDRLIATHAKGVA
jgi:hypothetical protein